MDQKLVKMPVLFVGHGSPMVILEENRWTKTWERLGETLPRPKSILCISAHWYTRGTWLMGDEKPDMIYDMYGFPQPMYEYVYPARSDASLVHRVEELLGEVVQIATDRGYDHGAYSVLKYLYPDANIPVTQLSIDATMPAAFHYELGKKLAPLREEGVLILGSGNVVHNLRLVDWEQIDSGFDWAERFDDLVQEAILHGKHQKLVDYEHLEGGRLAAAYPDHYLPLLYVAGAASEGGPVEVFNKDYTMGALSMTGYEFE